MIGGKILKSTPATKRPDEGRSERFKVARQNHFAVLPDPPDTGKIKPLMHPGQYFQICLLVMHI